MEFGLRVKKLRQSLDLTQQELANKIGIGQSTIGQIESGRNKSIKPEKLLQLANALNTTSEYLIYGNDEPINPKEAIEMPPAGSIAIQEEVDLSHTHLAIDFYDYKLSAGTGTAAWVPNRKESPLVFRENWFKAKRLNPSDLRAMYVRGDSMTPELNDWDTVIIDITDLEIIDGAIYACVYKEKLYIKRIQRSEDGILLISSNTDYETMEVNQDTADRFQLLGRMVWRGG